MAGGSSNPHHKVDTTPRSGLVWGIGRGHKTTRRIPAARASRRKGKLSQRSAVVNSVVREVAGFAPYERRAMELIRNSKVSILKDCRRLGGDEAYDEGGEKVLRVGWAPLSWQ
jgi:hypothetical protein